MDNVDALRPYADFAEASRAVLDYLAATLPLGAWMVTRRHADHWVLLRVDDSGYGIQAGDHVAASDTLCEQVVGGRVPNIVPDTAALASLRGCAALTRARIGTYVSFPLIYGDGALFGTLCGVDPEPGRADAARDAAMLQLLARQLSTILHHELARERAWREKLRAEAAAETDALTGLLNRRGFDLVLDRTEARCRDLGTRASIVQIDLDGLKALNDREGHAAGDALLRAAARAIAATLGPHDAGARTGGDEFTLLIDGDAAHTAHYIATLRTVLAEAGVAASLGHAERKPRLGLAEAWERADHAMYADKAKRTKARQTA